ncbi:NmrA family NAD(P)-binding protein [Flavilitoribacter nigricans]|uniref:NmrA family transcriptional regulator n=1 Tax=Flavilitoribacter nigricans (strain ATCC 23147 / DSM 23189 / NBRC 102662 / NCIMB 1420 / SS-2) TaxID=1122177 RepID=A0A2D0N374_FLAN2|nr:NAD(P)H-binding protein [Flavilitoribacter nigricans]PHN02992.1 NmrA family transcriptional regulator [Flavilitoribacter nigricans DSM 23189 = NBRC 102662]
MTNNILVIGGTGKTGRKIVEKLQALHQNVRVGSRRANPAFDWEDPSTWAAALDGMDKVYITFQPDLAVPGALDAIEALSREARRSGIRKMVLLSGKGEKEAELCEQVVIHSGIDYTIIRASWFNQNFSESFFLEPILAGQVALPQAEAQVPYVDTDDIADVAVAALLDDRHNGEIYQLTGPDTWTFPQVMEEISRVTGRSIEFTPISLTAYQRMLESFQLPPDYVWLINYLFTEVLGAENNNVVTHDIEKVLGRKAKSFPEYVRETALTGVWDVRLAEVSEG